MRVLLDLNVLLDIALAREPFAADAKGVADACADGRAIGFVSAVSVPTLFYVGRRAAGRELAIAAVDRCLQSFQVCPVDRAVLLYARQYAGSDFEDDVQIAAAASAKLDAVVTRDRTGFSNSPIPVISPAEFLKRLSRP